MRRRGYTTRNNNVIGKIFSIIGLLIPIGVIIGLGIYRSNERKQQAIARECVNSQMQRNIAKAQSEREEAEQLQAAYDAYQEYQDAHKCVDADGNIYETVTLGDQVWMAENMRSTKDRDGNRISLGDTYSCSTPYRYCPDDNSSNVSMYGYLYNWEAAMKVCPKGWHLPSEAEWTQLTRYVKSQPEYVSAGCTGENNEWYTSCIAKALASKKGWRYPDSDWADEYAVGKNQSANNATGFSALPAGEYYGSYNYFGYDANFWSATEYSSDGAYYRYLYYNSAGVRRPASDKPAGFSVRCVRD